ncbi:hypothetical protein DYB35_008326 [Aphanomyces astaci]|uniref:Uncharacterized protein n=1 Tax=Aphanomyces astaci TaxID=112090 RepID=A0A418DIH3_APHAT|nr:hypothetical protein DYB35_008326 [Aphanomyces astaci]
MHAVHQPSLVSLVVEPLQGPLRQGTWTEAEVAYVALLSKFFKAGLLECVEPGHSIRKWLASIIKCDPMRISKRLTKSARLGIVPYKRNQPSLDAMSSFERRAFVVKSTDILGGSFSQEATEFASLDSTPPGYGVAM